MRKQIKFTTILEGGENMSTFIAEDIIKQANISLSNGQARYRAYFISTTLYAKYQSGTNSILTTTDTTEYPNGYGDCIVTE